MKILKRGSAVNKKNTGICFNNTDLQLTLIAIIPALFVLVFNYLPMVGIIIAFKNFKYNQGVFGSEWVGLRNFEFFLKSNDFLNVTWNTISLNALFIFFGVITSVLLALLMYGVSSRAASKVYQTAVIVPYFISWVIAGYVVYAFLNPHYGILNSFLKNFGVGIIDWYSEPDYWPYILLLISIWKSVGIDSIVYYAALMAIDTSLIEAGRIDGANNYRVNRHIILPSIIPLIVMLSILKIGKIFRADFGLFYQVTRDSAFLYAKTDVIDTYLYRTMKETSNMGVSTAIGLLQSVVGFIMITITNKLSKRIDKDLGLY